MICFRLSPWSFGPGPICPRTFVAMTIFPRLPRDLIQRPITSSLTPPAFPSTQRL